MTALLPLLVLHPALAADCPDVEFETLVEARAVLGALSADAAFIRATHDALGRDVLALSCATEAVDAEESDTACTTDWMETSVSTWTLACESGADGYDASGEMVETTSVNTREACEGDEETVREWDAVTLADPARTYDPWSLELTAELRDASWMDGTQLAESWGGEVVATYVSGASIASSMSWSSDIDGFEESEGLEVGYPECGVEFAHATYLFEFENDESWVLSTREHLLVATKFTLADCANPDLAYDVELDGISLLADADTWELLEDDDLDDSYAYWGDCDDARADVSPCAEELCDGADNDCNGGTDEPWYVYDDADGDGYGDPASAHGDCDGPDGIEVDNADDCNDANADANPEAFDNCGGADDDCDGAVGEWGCPDADGDGYGSYYIEYDPTCSGFAASCDDCDDADPAVHPGAEELANDLDDDCDGPVDEGLDLDTGDSGDTGSADSSGAPPKDDGECGCAAGSSAATGALAGYGMVLLGGALSRRRR